MERLKVDATSISYEITNPGATVDIVLHYSNQNGVESLKGAGTIRPVEQRQTRDVPIEVAMERAGK